MNEHSKQTLLSIHENLFENFTLEFTEDGSPTLRLKQQTMALGVDLTPQFDKRPEARPESMHHSLGAASETDYIYTQPFKQTLVQAGQLGFLELNVTVVGLGLSYIEQAFIQYHQEWAEKRSQSFQNLKINLISYEKVTELRDKLLHWINTDSGVDPRQDFNTVRANQVYDLVSQKVGLKSKIFLKQALSGENQKISWFLKEELGEKTVSDKAANFIAFDAFSKTTDHPLWSENFLDKFLTQDCAADCVFTTYACTGFLKRTLIKHGFKFIKRPGFAKKRDSTLAFRGKFTDFQFLCQSV